MLHRCGVVGAGWPLSRAPPWKALQEQDRMLRERQSGEVQAESFCPDIPCQFPATAPMSVPHPVMEEPCAQGQGTEMFPVIWTYFSSQVS